MANADILSFGGRKLDELYNETGSSADVFSYLRNVIEKYDTLYPQITEETKKELEVIRDQIVLLSLPDGAELRDIAPPQHIRRSEDPVWSQTKKAAARKEKGLSKFKLLAEVSKHDWAKYSPDKRLYWNQYDLLGLFFSKMGPAPGGSVADQSKFFLPLTAVYAKFCLWIGSNQIPLMKGDDPKKKRKGDGVGEPPACFQITWREDTGQFFLGASLAGFKFNDLDYGTWESVVRGARYHLLDRFPDFPGPWGLFEHGRSPAKRWDGKQTLFGNCGETYPFLEMIGSHVDDTTRARTRGLALGRSFAGRVAEYRTEDFFPMLTPPCMNCQQLLRFVGIEDVTRFTQDSQMNTPLFPVNEEGWYQPGGREEPEPEGNQ